MATKVTVLGEPKFKPTGDKSIEFVSQLVNNMELECPCEYPSQQRNILLLRRNYGHTKQDLMYCYDTDPSMGALFLGHFNSGKV